MLSKILELLGAVCFLVFAYILWPPAALALLGALLVFAGYLSDDVKINVRFTQKPPTGEATE